MSNSMSRRSLAKGAAWAVPSLTVAAAAPAMAASPIPVLVANNTVTYGLLPNGSSSGDTQYRVYTSPNNRNDPPNSVSSCGPEITGATNNTTVTNVSMIYWLPQSNLTFANNTSGAATSGWSLLARATSLDGSRTDTSGRKVYAYSTTFSGPLVVNNGTICLGIQNFISTNGNSTRPSSYDATLSATVNGRVLTEAGTKVNIP